MWLLLLVSFPDPTLVPVPVARFPANDACQIRATKANKHTMNGFVQGEIRRPEGSLFVCFQLVGPT